MDGSFKEQGCTITLQQWDYYKAPDGEVVMAEFARKLERERDEVREQIAASAINTNVRLFDLVRYSRASLHEDELITDEEYAWLCGGAEMANSPKGGSPSPRRLEDYDEIRKQLEALREAIGAAHHILNNISALNETAEVLNPSMCMLVTEQQSLTALGKLQPFLKP